MWVLHAHWQPPQRSADLGGMIFWAETSEELPPTQLRRLSQRIKVREHPFCLPPELIRERVGSGTPLEAAPKRPIFLKLPTGHQRPLPSPELNHDWEVDLEQRPTLMTWAVSGLWLPLNKAFGVLANLPVENLAGGYVLGQDTRYWRTVTNLVMEVLAEQNFLPILVEVDERHNLYHARWQPVLDGPRDGQRLAQLAGAMPPICRAEAELMETPGSEAIRIIPRELLESFLNTMTDALARSWGAAKARQLQPNSDDLLERWLYALFQEDARVNASAAQLEALESSLRAWRRNLEAAGTRTYRIAYQLTAPVTQPADPNEPAWELRYLLQSRDDPSLLLPAEDVWRTGSSALVQLGRRFEQPQEKLLAGLGYTARIFPPILSSLQARQPVSVKLDTKTAYAFLRDAGPLLEQAGFGLIAPTWWNRRDARLGVSLHLKPGKSARMASGKLGLDTLVRFEWKLSLGETTLTREEFEALAALKMPLVQVRGQWVQLDSEQVEAAIHFWEKQRQTGEMSLVEAAQLALGGKASAEGLDVEEVSAEGWVEDWLDQLQDQERLSELGQPPSLKGELRPYQRFGFSWLEFFRRFGLGAVLADDMGLGKTIQALSLMAYEKDSLGKLPGPVLLVCPTSVVTNWEREAKRFTPDLKVLVHQGPDRLRNSEFQNAARASDLVVTSYALLRTDAELIQSLKWYGAILDEAQNIKNPAAKQTQSARKLQSSFRFALTGTPVENRLSELWSIMQFLNPGFLGGQEAFRREFSVPIERFSDPDATERLRRLVSPFILRRVKTDPRVIQDLPEKIEMKEYCPLTEEQATLYEAVVKDNLKKVDEREGIERHGQVLTMLMQLKQVCNHPAQYLHQISPEPGATLVKSGDGRESARRSGKLARLGEMLEEIIAAGDHALIFTQFAEMGKLLAEVLPQMTGSPALFLHGGTPPKVRDQMVQRFQEDENAPQIFILSLKAGGTGLNLTRASHVFHFDRWWNPAVEDQATDRTYRIGQVQNVQVHKFICTGTLEERIDEMIESKKGLADAIIGTGEQWLTELSTDDLRDLVTLRR
ncbi:superfamily II DNA/RNA helicase, SNF2 family [Longilinea arvoryzae]|uniref:Superfamily II DNA/RNA helicase, SNF2 family n=1 Tax=Longilinea arvoryzae TaxID=360412 RepID=A0A0S7BJM9_9CHLR|nr:DEAD/DEAH box helicase [Longilinea arvoryzae]GAP13850.1 superfamily II DNA/RNA helicase, SNF2 family [Longilinea arvoryzae]